MLAWSSWPFNQAMTTRQYDGQPRFLPDYKKWVALRDGRQVLLRPILSSDKDAILALFDRLSIETRYLRFQHAKQKISPEELEGFCCVDYYDCFALVAEMLRSGRMEIVGVGRYIRLPRRDSAEVAFVVEDMEQRNGIGTHLLSELACFARERDVTTFVAELLNENVVMLDIMRKCDPHLIQVVDGSSLVVTLSLDDSKSR
jgi:RimJ/RimL family protein N-acetyltransferase